MGLINFPLPQGMLFLPRIDALRMLDDLRCDLEMRLLDQQEDFRRRMGDEHAWHYQQVDLIYEDHVRAMWKEDLGEFVDAMKMETRGKGNANVQP